MTQLCANEELYTMLNLRNYYSDPVEIMAAVALYDKSDVILRLEQIVEKKQIYSPMANESFTIPLKLPENVTGKIVKVFLWDDALNPISNVIADLE
ncbi:hypothetical protein [Ructibacterium gallinarum]|uniref:Uncharacterized protein n=1 Tax=Ructibacterium gallinarum TaxID=2779355 RepID=A0A9D5M294_9FIRM|nr:hypothetical protein [Ructibacterium gallinarum]MBE5041257.1 hypothetical protein [Ructibacterium gallinarum]